MKRRIERRFDLALLIVGAITVAPPACTLGNREKAASEGAADERAPSTPAASRPKTALRRAGPGQAPKKRQKEAGAGSEEAKLEMGGGGFAALAEAPPPAEVAAASDVEGDPHVAAPPARAWFPETFLFEPLVQTDDQGVSLLRVRVPDRLTTWRVLALAHSRDGAQAGAQTTFLGTLPTYVDPIAPSFLMEGDEVVLPIQIVNTTSDELIRPLRVEVRGAAQARLDGPVRIPAAGSRVEEATVRARRAGTAVLRASLGEKDAVERSFPVFPTGRPIQERRGGTLAAPRSIAIELPADLSSEGATARLLVYPGALAILRSELGAASRREGTAEDAYTLLLAGRSERLLHALGGEPDPQGSRTLALVAAQRVIRAARAPETATAALLAEAALAHPDNPVLARLGERLLLTVANAQRPDGTFEGGDGWTLQRLLVATAECLRAVRTPSDSTRARQRAARATLLAEGAFERHIERVDDPYTAAAILAGGAVQGTLRDELRKRVRDAIRERSDGSRVLPVSSGVVRGDGQAPSETEATALAVLALSEDREAAPAVADLGASLLSSYRPGIGFGDGRTNLVALEAVLSLFKEPLPEHVEITLLVDERPTASGRLEGRKSREVLAIEAPLSSVAGRHVYAIRAVPAVPGLGFSLEVQGYAPWKREHGERGLELEIETPKEAHRGAFSEVGVTVSAPEGRAVTIRYALPAGVEPDRASLDLLASEGGLRAYSVEDGAVVLSVAPLQNGTGSFSARYRVIPTLRGILHSAASSASLEGGIVFAPPTKWTVR